MTVTTGRLQVFVPPSSVVGLRVAVAQKGHGWAASGMHTDRVVGALKGELPVGDLTGVTASPAYCHADKIPALAVLAVGLSDAVGVHTSMAAQLAAGRTAGREELLALTLDWLQTPQPNQAEQDETGKSANTIKLEWNR